MSEISCKIEPLSEAFTREETRPKKFPHDRFDTLSLLAITILSIWAIILICLEMARPDPLVRQNSKENVFLIDPQTEQLLTTTKNLLASGNIDKAEELIRALKDKLPYDARPFMLDGDLFLHKQDNLLAMHAYRLAVDLNIDYLDKKTPIYQGKKIRNAVEEARKAIVAGLKSDWRNPTLVEAKKEYYYMLRKLAGGCGG